MWSERLSEQAACFLVYLVGAGAREVEVLVVQSKEEWTGLERVEVHNWGWGDVSGCGLLLPSCGSHVLTGWSICLMHGSHLCRLTSSPSSWGFPRGSKGPDWEMLVLAMWRAILGSKGISGVLFCTVTGLDWIRTEILHLSLEALPFFLYVGCVYGFWAPPAYTWNKPGQLLDSLSPILYPDLTVAFSSDIFYTARKL